MTNKKQITQQAYNELQEKFDDLKEEMNSYVVAEEKSYGQWVPNIDAIYFYIKDNGSIGEFNWRDTYINRGNLSIGNVYKTKGKAEAKVKYLKALTKVKNRIAELNEGWVPDWGDMDSYKFYAVYSFDIGQPEVSRLSVVKLPPDSLYLKSEKLAKQLIKELPEELTLILRDS
jgi:hypothetical protein